MTSTDWERDSLRDADGNGALVVFWCIIVMIILWFILWFFHSNLESRPIEADVGSPQLSVGYREAQAMHHHCLVFTCEMRQRVEMKSSYLAAETNCEGSNQKEYDFYLKDDL